MRIKFEDLGLKSNEVARYRSFSGEMFDCPLHYHDCYELTLIRSSTGVLEVGNESYAYQPGQLFLFAPGVAHSFKHEQSNINDDQSPEGLVLLINEKFIKSKYIDWEESFLLKTLLDNSESGLLFHINDCRRTKLLYKHFSQKDITGFQMLKNVSTILFELAETKQFKLLQHLKKEINIDSKEQNAISKVTFYIHTHFNRELTVDEVAKVINMSYTSFSRFFKQKMKMNFSAYLQKVRLSHAKKLLVETNLTVGQICYESGFNNPPFFNRVFKQSQACSPKEYRTKYQ